MRLISITSGKGGVGKTNLAANLGIALVQSNQRVVIFDADLGLSNLDVVLGATPEYSLHHALEGALSLSDTIAKGPAGVRFLSGGSGVSKLIHISKKRLQKFLLELAELESSTDILIFDTGAGVDNRMITFSRAADEVILVVTPDPASVTDAYATVKVLLRNHKNANIQVVMNQVDSEKQGEAIFKKLTEIAGHFLGADLAYLGSVRKDDEIVPWIRQRKPFYLADPRCKASRDLAVIAKSTLMRAEQYRSETNIVERLEEAFGIVRETPEGSQPELVQVTPPPIPKSEASLDLAA